MCDYIHYLYLTPCIRNSLLSWEMSINIYFRKNPNPWVFSLKLVFSITPDCWEPPVLSVHEPSYCSSRRLWYHWHDSWWSDQFWPEEKLGDSGQGPSARGLQQAVWRRKWASRIYKQLFIRDISEVQVRGVLLEKLAKRCKSMMYVLCSELELRDRNLRLHGLLQVSTEGRRKRDKQAGSLLSGAPHPTSRALVTLNCPSVCDFYILKKMKYLLFGGMW